MKKTIILLILSCACFNLQAQLNHVLNGSFEQHSNCPNAFDQIKFAAYWNSIDTSWSPGDTATTGHPGCLPEYENTCGTFGFTLPSTPWFYQYPHTGNALIQAVIYYNYGVAGLDQYNYLQGRLNNHLTAGKSYCVSFFVNRAHATGYSINKIGAYLDDGSIDTTSRCAVPQTQYTPQVLDTSIISDTLSWTRIQGSFIASGTERFITIGDFFDTGSVSKIYIPGNNFGVYLIDDVSVIASDAVADAGADTFIRQGDTAQVGAIKNGDGMPCWWYIMGNTAPIDSGGTIKVHPSVTTTYVVKMDLCGTITYDTVKVWVWPSSVSNQQPAVRNCRVYPNPSAGALTIQNASGCEVVLYDVLGREALRPGQLSSGPADAIDISALPKGVYLLKVTDTITGENITLRLLKE
jgi:hypothetical protein